MSEPFEGLRRRSAVRRAFDTIASFTPAPVSRWGGLNADDVRGWAGTYRRENFDAVVVCVADRLGVLAENLARQSIEPDLGRDVRDSPMSAEANSLLSAAIRGRAVAVRRFGRKVPDDDHAAALPHYDELKRLVASWLRLHPDYFDAVRREMAELYLALLADERVVPPSDPPATDSTPQPDKPVVLVAGPSTTEPLPAEPPKAVAKSTPQEQTSFGARATVFMLEAQRKGLSIPSVRKLAITVGCHASTLYRDKPFMAARTAAAANPVPVRRGRRTDAGDIEAEAD